MASVSEQMCWNTWLYSYRLSRHCQILMSLGWQRTCVFLFVSDILILNQQLEFAGRWKNVPILFLETNSNFDFVLYLSHIRKCNFGYQIVSICSVFLGTFPCAAWAVLKGLFTLLCRSLKFRNSSKICSVNRFLKRNGFSTFDT